MRTPRFPVALVAALLFVAAPVSLFADLEPDGRSSYSLDDGSSGGDSSPKPCGMGTKIECGSVTLYKCVSWKTQPTIGPAGGGYTYVCDQSVTTVLKLYKDD